MSEHTPSVRAVIRLRRQIGSLLEFSQTPARFQSRWEQGLSINFVRLMYQTTMPYRLVDGKQRLTPGWPFLFPETLEKINKAVEGPMRRWGLMDDRRRGKPPEFFALEPDEIRCLEAIASELDRALRGVEPPDPAHAMALFFYTQRSRPKGQKLTDKQILAKAKREHPEWDCNFTPIYMRKLADKFAIDNNLPQIERRPYTRS